MLQNGSGHYSGFPHMAYCFKVMHTQQSKNMYSYSENNCRLRAMLRTVFIKNQTSNKILPQTSTM